MAALLTRDEPGELAINRDATARSSWWRLAGVFAAFIAIVVRGFVGAVLLAKWVWTMAS